MDHPCIHCRSPPLKHNAPGTSGTYAHAYQHPATGIVLLSLSSGQCSRINARAVVPRIRKIERGKNSACDTLDGVRCYPFPS